MKTNKRDTLFIFIGTLLGSLFLFAGMDKIENHITACFVSFVGGLLSFFVPQILMLNFNPRGSSGNTKGDPRG
jgi:hypothetical protein